METIHDILYHFDFTARGVALNTGMIIASNDLQTKYISSPKVLAETVLILSKTSGSTYLCRSIVKVESVMRTSELQRFRYQLKKNLHSTIAQKVNRQHREMLSISNVRLSSVRGHVSFTHDLKTIISTYTSNQLFHTIMLEKLEALCYTYDIEDFPTRSKCDKTHISDFAFIFEMYWSSMKNEIEISSSGASFSFSYNIANALTCLETLLARIIYYGKTTFAQIHPHNLLTNRPLNGTF